MPSGERSVCRAKISELSHLHRVDDFCARPAILSLVVPARARLEIHATGCVPLIELRRA